VLSHRHVQLNRSLSHYVTQENHLEYHIISTLCTEEANTSFHLCLRTMHPTHGIFHMFTCAQPQARPTQQIFFLTALHRRIIWSIISTLCTEENSKPITWAPSPLTGVHNIPSPSQRGTTHPTPHSWASSPHTGAHNVPSLSQRGTTHPAHGHTQLMGFLSGRLTQSVSWRMSHAVVIINTPSQLGRHSPSGQISHGSTQTLSWL
jgi:hypothetical protein